MATSYGHSCSVEKVSNLLNQPEVGWNDQLLNQLFCANEVSAMRKVPVGSFGLNDKLVWHATKTGQYSVQSGYKLDKSMQKQKEGDEGSSERRELEDRKLWQTIWNLDIKRKVQHFMWRLCHNRLLVGANLKQRGIEVDGIYKQCGVNMETAEHVLFHCVKAELIWKLAPVQWEGIQHHTFTFKEWWRELASASKQPCMQDRLEITAYLIWHIWKARNRWNFEAYQMPELEVVQKAVGEWAEFRESQQKEEVGRVNRRLEASQAT